MTFDEWKKKLDIACLATSSGLRVCYSGHRTYAHHKDAERAARATGAIEMDEHQ